MTKAKGAAKGGGKAGRRAETPEHAARKRKYKAKLRQPRARAKQAESKLARLRHRRSWTPKIAATVVALMLVLGVLSWRIWRSDYMQMHFVYMWPYQQEILRYAEANRIDPFLVAAIIKNESDFDHRAVSSVGAMGLMQLMPDSASWIAGQMGLQGFETEQLYLPVVNIRMGCWYVGELEHEFHRNLVLTVAAYNAGRGRTHEWMEKYGWDYDFGDVQAIPYDDTREYVDRVLQDRDAYYLYYRDVVEQPAQPSQP